MSNNMKVALGLMAFVLLIGVVGHFDYEDEVASEALYCDNVKEKIWPDFKGTYKKYCKNFSSERLTQPKSGV